MKGPYARLRELCKIGQREFERKYGLSHTVMSAIETGMYPDLSERAIESLGRECVEKGIEAGRTLWEEYGAATLQEAYHAWQTVERRAVRSKLQFPDGLHTSGKVAPFKGFILERFDNPRAFCTALKVPTATVNRYLSGVTRTMPKAVEDALAEAGMAKKNLAWLKDVQAEWVEAHA